MKKIRRVKTIALVLVVFILSSCRIFGGKNEKCPAYSQSENKANTEITQVSENK